MGGYDSYARESAYGDWFPVRITGGGSSAGWTFVEVRNLVGGTTEDLEGGRRGTADNPGFPVVGGQTFAEDEIALCRPAPGAGATEWELVAVAGGGGSGSGGSFGDCSGFLDVSTDACLTYSVASAAGRCSGVDDGQTGVMAWNGSAFEGQEDFVTPVITAPLVLTPVPNDWPTLTLDTYEFKFVGCSGDDLEYVGVGTDICDGTPAEGCGDNRLVIRIACGSCTNPDYGGAGWYCVATGGATDCSGATACVELSSDPGPATVICSGPHIAYEACAAACLAAPPDPVIRTCDGGDHSIPGRLYATISNATNRAAPVDGLVIPLDFIGGGVWGSRCTTTPEIDSGGTAYSYHGTDLGASGVSVTICPSGDFPPYFSMSRHALYANCNQFDSNRCFASGDFTVVSWSPFVATATGLSVSDDGVVCTGTAGTIDVTVTE